MINSLDRFQCQSGPLAKLAIEDFIGEGDVVPPGMLYAVAANRFWMMVVGVFRVWVGKFSEVDSL